MTESAKEVHLSSEELWHDIKTTSFSFRRHGEPGKSGLLTRNGLIQTEQEAEAWIRHLPLITKARFFQSPSFIPIPIKDEEPLKAQRATITARIYQRVYEHCVPTSTQRVSHNDLSDLFQEMSQPQEIGSLLETINAHYSGDHEAFFKDYVRGSISAELQKILHARHVTTAIELVRKLCSFIESNSQSNFENVKQVNLAITHEESIAGFEYYVKKFLAERGDLEAEDVKRIPYGAGFDVHILPDNRLVVQLSDNQTVVLNLSEFKSYLQKEAK